MSVRSRFSTLIIFLIATACVPEVAAKDYLTINSVPPGARVEIDGIVVGTTPYKVEIPGGYLHGTKSVFGKVLRTQLRLRLSLDGYLPIQVDMARGPMPWVALNGTYHGDYYLLKTSEFSFSLEKAATSFSGTIEVASSKSYKLSPATGSLGTEEVVRLANPAVVLLQGTGGSGSGFIVSENGLAVTNAHVASGNDQLIATSANGQKFQCRVLYVDDKLDIALIKVDGDKFPYLPVSDNSRIAAGATVVAIGTPAQGFQNSVTKGIVSGVGPLNNEPGVWIQTDAAINPGNSGGPLLNDRAQVVGINTQKRFVSGDGRPLQSIGFALSSDDLLTVLEKFYPQKSPTNLPPSETSVSKTKITITSDTADAEVFVDDKLVGNTPAMLMLVSGKHTFVVKNSAGELWKREVELLPDSELRLNAVLHHSQ